MAQTGCATGSHSAEQSDHAAPVLSEAQEKARQAAEKPLAEPKPVVTKSPFESKPGLSIPPRPKRARTTESDMAAALPKLDKNGTPFPIKQDLEQDPEDASPVVNTRCKRLGCTTDYADGLERQDQECQFHPGQPLFHGLSAFYGSSGTSSERFLDRGLERLYLLQNSCTGL